MGIPKVSGSVAAPALIRSALMDEAGVAGSGDGSRTVVERELGQDDGNVVANCLLRQAESVGDLVVAVPGSDQVEHLAFSDDQLGEGLSGVLLVGLGEEVDDAAGDAAAAHGLTGGDGEDRPDDVVAFGVLE